MAGNLLRSYGKWPFLMGKSTISMVNFNSYVSLPEGKWLVSKKYTVIGDICEPLANHLSLVFQLFAIHLVYNPFRLSNHLPLPFLDHLPLICLPVSSSLTNHFPTLCHSFGNRFEPCQPFATRFPTICHSFAFQFPAHQRFFIYLQFIYQLLSNSLSNHFPFEPITTAPNNSHQPRFNNPPQRWLQRAVLHLVRVFLYFSAPKLQPERQTSSDWWFGTFSFPIYWECHHPN